MYKIILKKYKNLSIQVRASLWLFLCTFLEKGIAIITTPIYTRLLNTSEYGQYSIFISWLELMTVFVSLNLFSGVFSRGLVKFEERKKIFCSSLQGLSFTLLIFWLVIYLLFYKEINIIFQLKTIQSISLFLIIWTNSIFKFWSMSERMEFKYKKLIILTLVTIILKPVLSILLIFSLEDKVTGRILGILVINFIVYIFLFIKQLLEGKSFFNREFWIYSLKFNLPLIPHYLSTSILNSADRIMISKLAGEKEAGIYSLAYSLSLIMTIFNTVLYQTIEPWLYIKIKRKEYNEISKIAYFLLIMIAFFNIIFIAFAPEIISIFAPQEYFQAIWIIPPVAMSAYFMFSYIFFAVLEFYYEKTKYIVLGTFFGALLNIFLNYLYINKYGYIAAGYTTLICYICYSALHFYFMKLICKKYLENIKIYNVKILILISIIFVSVGFLLLFSYKNNILRYIIILSLLILPIFYYKKIFKYIKELISIKNIQ